MTYKVVQKRLAEYRRQIAKKDRLIKELEKRRRIFEEGIRK